MDLEMLMQESIELMQADFYNKKFYFSYSSLNKLMWNPAVFYQQYILGNKEEKLDAHLVQGKLVHCLLLEENNFDQLFIKIPKTMPTGNNRTTVDLVFRRYKELQQHGNNSTELVDFDQDILYAMKELNYYQALKTDQQRLDKIVTPENESYWEYLKIKGNKVLVDEETYNFCKQSVDLIKTNQQVCNLIGYGASDFDNRTIKNELLLSCDTDFTKLPFGLKGIIDNLVIDDEQKIIYINDLKTTSKDLKDFPESMEFYSYWMQGIIYTTLVSANYKHLISQGYQVKFHFVVIDRIFQVYCFPVKHSTLDKWALRLEDVFKKAEWHYVNQSYHLPYEFATGKVVL